ncbi:unnamed protein product, partial [Amoebophrya sp. A25]
NGVVEGGRVNLGSGATPEDESHLSVFHPRTASSSLDNKSLTRTSTNLPANRGSRKSWQSGVQSDAPMINTRRNEYKLLKKERVAVMRQGQHLSWRARIEKRASLVFDKVSWEQPTIRRDSVKEIASVLVNGGKAGEILRDLVLSRRALCRGNKVEPFLRVLGSS